MLAISADAQSFAWSTGQTLGARYQILSDSERKVITSYGVLNAAEHDGIAHPSVFILDKAGRIRYIYVGKDPQDRPSDETILEEVRKITAAK